MSKYLVYAIGHALVDTDVYVDDSDLDHLRIGKGAMTLVDEARQEHIKSYLANKLADSHSACGGSAANSIIATAQFGAPTYMSCLVADDDDGDIYIDDLEASGVDHGSKNKRANGTTGKCLVLITPDAERSMNTFLGVSEYLSVKDVDEAAIATSTWVYLEGYLITSRTTHAAVMKTKQLANSTGAKVAVSFADRGIVTIFRDNMNALLEGGIDFVFCNEVEALAWADTDNLQLAAERLKTICNGFVITRGSSSTILYDGYAMHQVDSQKVNAINSLGAGDMFAGAFFYGLGQGVSMVAACEFASRAASMVVCQAGPRLSMHAARALRDEYFRN